MRRVVVTGMGVVSSLGCSVQSSFDRLHILKNAVEKLPELEQYEGLNAHLGSKVSDFVKPAHYTRKALRTMGQVSIYALNATEQALIQAGLMNSETLEVDPILQSGQTGVAYGSSFGSVEPVLDFYSMIKTNVIGDITSSTYVKMMPHTTAVNLSVHFKTTGRLIPTGTACTSGSLAVGNAYEMIKYGIQDVMIAGGSEEFHATDVAVFDVLYATSCKNDKADLTPAPYDVHRDGLVIGEGAGTLILEEYEHAKARGANILAEVVGFYNNTDGTHITQPNAQTIQICMEKALESAKLDKNQIGYICAHGTGTKFGDMTESQAVYNVFGNKTPMSSLKSYNGHSLGACGALESIWSIMMMQNNWYAPTLNLTEVDPECGDLDYIVEKPRQMEQEFVMNNNFAFGGINTSLIFKRI